VQPFLRESQVEIKLDGFVDGIQSGVLVVLGRSAFLLRVFGVTPVLHVMLPQLGV
jgi:hypothetical protein